MERWSSKTLLQSVSHQIEDLPWLTPQGETQGQVTLGDSESQGCHVRKHRMALTSLEFCVKDPVGYCHQKGQQRSCLLFYVQIASHHDHICLTTSGN